MSEHQRLIDLLQRARGSAPGLTSEQQEENLRRLILATGHGAEDRGVDREVKQLGMEALLREGGVISRLDWEAVDGTSLMQETARELGATPFRTILKQPK